MKSNWKLFVLPRNLLFRKVFWLQKINISSFNDIEKNEKIFFSGNVDNNKNTSSLQKVKKSCLNLKFKNSSFEFVTSFDTNLPKLYLWNKQVKLTKFFLNSNLSVYNGLKFVTYVVKDNFLGASAGKFILTKRITAEIHMKKKKDKKKKKRSK